MADTHLEVERKYDAPADVDLPDLSSLSGVAAVGDPQREELEAVYFDTADLHLAHRGVTLRRRTGGHDAGWHLKLPAGSDGRTEVRVPLARAKVSPPKQLRELILALTGGAPLGPVVTLRTVRTVRPLLAGDDACLAEVSEDEVRAFDGSAPEVLLAWREWEVELVEGESPLLDGVEALLAAEGITRGRMPSKLARVLADRLARGPRSARPRRKGPARDVLHARLAEQVEVLKLRDVDVRRDAADSVHQLRVAMRRLRGALATFRPLVRREATDPLREELKWIAGLLGEARDAEVMCRRLDRAVAAQPVELVLGEVRARIDHTLGTRYREARAAALEAMASPRYLELLTALDRLVDDPPWTPVADRRAKDVVPRLLRRDWRRIRRRVEAALAAEDRHERDLALHESRKAAKRLRYAAEAARPVLGKDAKQVVRAMKKAQTMLGDHQDSVVTRAVLRELGVQAQLEGDSAFTFGLLYGVEQQRATELEEQFRRRWRTRTAPRLQRLAG